MEKFMRMNTIKAYNKEKSVNKFGLSVFVLNAHLRKNKRQKNGIRWGKN